MPRSARPFLFSLLFLSGATGLIYETVFLSLVQNIIGGSLPALSLTLAVFMFGLAAGGAAGARLSASGAPAFTMYARLEFLLALAAWGSFGIYALTGKFAPFLDGLPLLRHGCAVLLVLPVPVLLGASLPLWIRALSATLETAGRSAGRLYFINTMGAAAGAYAAGFFLLEHLGILGSLTFASLGNVMIGFFVLKFSPAAGEPPRRAAPLPGKIHGAYPWVYALLGFVLLGCEMAWMRILEMRYLSTAYSFALVLSILLAGSALGSLLFGKFFDLKPKRFLADVFFLSTLTAGIAIAASPRVLGHFLNGLSVTSFAGLMGLEALVTLAGILAPALLMGFTFPLMLKLSVDKPEASGPASGRLYAANAMGAVLGSLFIPLMFIPFLGLSGSLQGLSLLCLAAAPALLVLTQGARAIISRRGLLFISLAVTAALFPRHRLLAFADPQKGEAVTYYREGPMATVEVVDYAYSPVRSLKVNAIRAEGGTHPEALQSQRLEAELPVFLRGQPSSLLFLGLGTGISLGGFKYFDSIQTIHCVEILKELKEVAPYFARENRDILNDPRVTLILDDARHFTSLRGKSYDLIVGDLFFPWLKGSGSLYTLEHFRHCKNRLRPGGLFCQWLPLYQLSEENFQIIANTFAREFPGAELWLGHLSPDKPTAMLAGFRDPDGPRRPPASPEHDPENYSARYLRKLRYDPAIRTASDLRPCTEFMAARDIFRQGGYAKVQLERLTAEYPTQDEATGNPDPARERLYALLQALVQTNHGDVAGALAILGDAAVNDYELRGFEFILPTLARRVDGENLDRFVPVMIPLLAKLTKRYRESDELFAELGKFRLLRKEIDSAATDLSEALALNPRDENAWTNLGIAHAMAGRDSQAVAAWKKVLEINPAHPGAAHNIRINLEKRGRAPR